MSEKVTVSRRFIDLDLDKMKESHPEAEIKCMLRKWNPFRDDWSQGFDSDCFGHCSNYENCSKAFWDKTLEKNNHFKEILITFDKKPCWEDIEIEILKG